MPSIQTQPQSLSLVAGANALFSVTAAGRPAVTYQWFFNGAAITGATNSTYSLSGVQSGNAGAYTVVASNLVGFVTSIKAALTVVDAPASSVSSGNGGGSNGSGGGGNGGAPSSWFYGALLLLVVVRWLRKPFSNPGATKALVGLRPPRSFANGWRHLRRTYTWPSRR
jgi:hypothetical protein